MKHDTPKSREIARILEREAGYRRSERDCQGCSRRTRYLPGLPIQGRGGEGDDTMTTLAEELEQAADWLDRWARVTIFGLDIKPAAALATRLRRRAARVRELMAGPRGYLSIAQQLTGPIPGETAPTERKEP